MNKLISTFTSRNCNWIKTIYLILASVGSVFNLYSADGAPNIKAYGMPHTSVNENNILVQYLTSAVWRNILLLSDNDDCRLIRQLSEALVMFQLFQPFTKNSTAVLFKYIPDSQRSRIVVYCKTQCQQHVVSLNYHLFHKKISWLFVHRSFQALDVFINFIHLRKLPRIDSEVFAMVNLEDQSYVFRVPFPSETDTKISTLHPVGSYNNHSWSLYHEHKTLYPLLEQILRFGIINDVPAVIIEKKGTSIEYGGALIQLVTMLSKYLGFSCQFVIEKTGVFGSVMENGTGTGLIGLLLDKKIDVASMTLALTKERLSAADFTSYILEANTMGMFRKPSQDTSTLDLFTYSRPFPPYLWFLLAVMLFFIFVCLTCSTTNEIRNRHADTWSLLKDSVNYTYWTIISFVIKMGLTHLPTKRSGRLILISSVFFVLVINSTYNSLLTAFLTVRKESILFNNFDDVLEDGTYNFVVSYHSAQHRALETATEGTFQKVWKKMAADPTSVLATSEDVIKKMYKGKYVIIQDHVTLEHLAAEDCSLSIIKQAYLKMTGHFVLQKNSQYSDIFSQKLLVMRSSGILQKELNKYFTKSDPADCSPDSLISSVRILEVAGAPTFLLLGLLTATFCFLVEIIVDRIISFKRSHVTKAYKLPVKRSYMIIHKM